MNNSRDCHFSARLRTTGPSRARARCHVLCLLPAMLFITLGQVACMSRGGGRDPARLTISAAVSLEEALQEIQQLYRRQKPDVQITYNFAGSGTLEQQIEQGAPVDVFISASPRELDALAVKGLLVEESRTDLVQNQIVLVTPRDPKLVNGFDDLTGAAVKRVALGEPETVPAGRYAKQVLTYFHLFDALQPKLIFTKDVRQALTYVATGNVDAALVYQTEARLATGVKVITVAPTGSHEPIVYPMAAVKTQRSPARALEFMRFLTGERAQAVFTKYGFILVGAKS